MAGQTLRVKFRSLWEEIKLRFRILRAAGAGLISHVLPAPVGRLYAVLLKADGTVIDLGLISTRVVTTAGVGYIVDAFQNIVELENLKYHGSGTGTVAEASSDTALGTEVESRSAGTTTEGASANIYRTVATITYTATRAITEHGIFSAASGGVLLDRSVFPAINVVNGDSIQFTYDLTFPAGS